MKKGLVLGAAALATVALAPVAEAGSISMKGYYMFRAQSVDGGLVDGDFVTNGADDGDKNAWMHRLEITSEYKASEKTHAHMKARFVDGSVDGADSNVLGADSSVASGGLTVKQAWFETEAYGVSLKMGNMPLALNDKILLNHDATAFGTFLVAKSFGDVTVIAADVKVDEGHATNDLDDSSKDIDVYAASVLGKVADVNLQLTFAALDGGSGATTGGAGAGAALSNVEGNWLALTASGALAGIDYTATMIYDGGVDYFGDAAGIQLKESDFLAALRLKGKTGFGGWSAYGFYAGEDFNSITDDNMGWSATWDMGGPGGTDLLGTWAAAADGGNSYLTANSKSTNASSNMWGIGAGLSIKAGGWTIKPHVDYASLVEEDLNGDGAVTAADALFESAIAGSLFASTQIDKGTTLMVGGAYGSFDEGPNFTTGTEEDSAGYIEASIKMAF
ncbi:hypothetical protein [Magnetococcus sp. PR-3]|uniref:hypothetical protein n=1 Tax=Magnetococcus sp. PR-3 TaxID=3120355 RepID=UPI002FCE6456